MINMSLIIWNSVLFLTALCILSVESLKAEVCVSQTSSCSCKTRTGHVNLEPLDEAKRTGKPRFANVTSSGVDGYYFSYNPCTGYTVPPYYTTEDTKCQNVAACEHANYGLYYTYPLGPQDSARFITDDQDNNVIQYSVVYYGKLRTMYVTLICDINEAQWIFTGEDAWTNYNFTMISKYACSDYPPHNMTTAPVHNVTTPRMRPHTTKPPNGEDKDFTELIFFMITVTFCACVLLIILVSSFLLIKKCNTNTNMMAKGKAGLNYQRM